MAYIVNMYVPIKCQKLLHDTVEWRESFKDIDRDLIHQVLKEEENNGDMSNRNKAEPQNMYNFSRRERLKVGKRERVCVCACV